MNTRNTLNRAWLASLRLIGIILLLGLGADLARAAEKQWSGSSELTYATSYLWRGQDLAKGSLQPSLTTTYSENLTLGYWGSYAIEEDSSKRKYKESDLFANYTIAQDAFSVTLGATYYNADFLVDPATGKSIDGYLEAYASVSLKTKLNPSISVWKELGKLDSHYFEFSLSHSIEVNPESRISIRPYAGFFSVLSGSENYYGFDVALSHDFTKSIYARATLTLIKSSFSGDRASFGVTSGIRW